MIKGIVFFEEYFEFMDDMTPEQYYEFMGLIRNLRFNGIDTKPEEVTDKVVRLAWRSVRPSIKKSKRNADDHDKKKQREQQEEPQVSTQTPLNECINDLMAVYNEKGYETMIYRINHKCREWGYPFEVLKAKCDSIIEENIVYGKDF